VAVNKQKGSSLRVKTSLTLISGHFFSSYEDVWKEKLAWVLILSVSQSIKKANMFEKSVNNLKLNFQCEKFNLKRL